LFVPWADDGKVFGDNLGVGLRIAKGGQLLHNAGEAQRKILNDLAFPKGDRLVLSAEILRRGLLHPIVANAESADRLPGFLGGCLGGERGDHVFWHDVADGVQRVPVVVELHDIPEMASLELQLILNDHSL